MKKLSVAVAAAAMVALFAGGAMAQSAKFAASWSNDVKAVGAEIFSDGDGTIFGPICTGDSTGGSGTSGDPCFLSVTTIATIQVPQWKDLLIGVSAEIGLVTLTQAKGKGGSTTLDGKALASAGIDVTLLLVEAGTSNVVQTAAPGTVTFASRLQELKVAVEDSDTENLTEVMVSLLLNTTAAHHFNFIGVDLPQGTYDVVAVFDLSAFVAIVGEDAIAEAKVILGSRMVTAQEVRAVKDGLIAF